MTEVLTHADLMARAEELKRAYYQELALKIKTEYMECFNSSLFATPQKPWHKRYSGTVPIDVRELYSALRAFFPDICICILPIPTTHGAGISIINEVIIEYARVKAPEDY